MNSKMLYAYKYTHMIFFPYYPSASLASSSTSADADLYAE